MAALLKRAGLCCAVLCCFIILSAHFTQTQASMLLAQLQQYHERKMAMFAADMREAILRRTALVCQQFQVPGCTRVRTLNSL